MNLSQLNQTTIVTHKGATHYKHKLLLQGVENSASNIIYFNTVNEIYPGNSSYQSRTGGALKNLRQNTTIEKVREYHKKYYRPENTYITITGK